MARMFPNRIPDDVESYAERRLYEMLREQLPDEWRVFYHARWLARSTRQGAQDGEIDFCIVSPEHGILVLEVKGGQIRVDGESGQWYSNGLPIQDPLAQADRSMRSLIAKMDDLPLWRSSRRPFVARAVAFPDVEVDRPLRPDAPAEIVLDARTMHYLPEWCEGVYAFFGRQEPLRPADMQALTDLLAPQRTLRLSMTEAIARDEEQIIELTEGQYTLLDFLQYQRRVAIWGCAGSGKTLLAAEQARRLAGQGYGVLLTCFNNHLAEHLSAQAALPDSVTVATFHGLCRQMCEAAGVSVSRPPEIPDAEWYDKCMPEMLLEAADRLGGRYDAILVDEGQDFASDFWGPLLLLLNDPEHGILWVFLDDNQNLYRTGLQLPEDLQPFVLTVNLRNTKRIHEAFCPFYRSRTGKMPEALGPDGRAPEILYCETDAEARAALRRVLHRLTHDEGVHPQDVVVLSPHRRSGVVHDLPRLGNLQLVATGQTGANEIECTTIWAYKGLEKAVVILTEMTEPLHQDAESLFYVGASRAKHHLVVITQPGFPEEVLERLPGETAER